MHLFKKVIIKIGTSSLTQGKDGLCRCFMLRLARQIAFLRGEGVSCILISSGAKAAGKSLLGDSWSKPALASVGQIKLMQRWSEIFWNVGLQAGQMLLIADDFSSDKKERTKQSIQELLNSGVIPVLNENDVLAWSGSQIGNNDHLAALVGKLIEADLLVLLTDQEGLYTANPSLDPKAKLISSVHQIDESIFALARGTSSQGTGGMLTKLEAAKLLLDGNIQMVIAHSSHPNVLIKLVQGIPIGTLFKRK